MRNSELFLLCKFTAKRQISVGSDSISARCKNGILPEKFCRGRVARSVGMTFFSCWISYENSVFRTWLVGRIVVWKCVDIEFAPTENRSFSLYIPQLFKQHRRSNVVGLKRSSLCSSRLFAEDSLFKENRMAQFTFIGLRNWFLIFRLSLFDVNCAFWFNSDYAIFKDFVP